MESANLFMNQYNSLRDEIKVYDLKNHKLLLLLLTASGIIITAGFNVGFGPNRLWIFLCVYFFYIPITGLIYVNRREIWKTSTYLRTFIEPKLKIIKWETRLAELEEILKVGNSDEYISGVLKKEIGFITSINFFALFALIINAIQIYCNSKYQVNLESILHFSPVIFGLITCLIFHFIGQRKEKELRRYGSIEKKYFNFWNELKSKNDFLIVNENSHAIKDNLIEMKKEN